MISDTTEGSCVIQVDVNIDKLDTTEQFIFKNS